MTRSDSHRCTLCGGAAKYRLATVGEQHLYRCRECGVMYTAPTPSDEEVEQSYAEDYIVSTDMLASDFGDRRATALDLAAEAVQRHRSAGTILDVGCAGGAFLARFPSERWTRTGVEPSSVGVDHAAGALEVFRGPFPSAVPAERRFEVITMMDVIMLIPSPDEALEAAHKLLEDDGLLAVEIPGNAFRMLGHVGPVPLLRRRRWTDLNLKVHLYFFPHRTFVQRLERAGFVLEHVHLLAPSSVGSRWNTKALRAYNTLLRTNPLTSRGRLSLGAKYLYIARKG